MSRLHAFSRVLRERSRTIAVSVPRFSKVAPLLINIFVSCPRGIEGAQEIIYCAFTVPNSLMHSLPAVREAFLIVFLLVDEDNWLFPRMCQ